MYVFTWTILEFYLKCLRTFKETNHMHGKKFDSLWKNQFSCHHRTKFNEIFQYQIVTYFVLIQNKNYLRNRKPPLSFEHGQWERFKEKIKQTVKLISCCYCLFFCLSVCLFVCQNFTCPFFTKRMLVLITCSPPLLLDCL